jgi:hypothetical protein
MASTTPSPKQASKSATDAFTCPECGKTFTRAAALGAHRKLKHGVAGTSSNAAGSRASGSRRGRKRTTAAARRTATTAANGGAPGVNRDALLRTLFPNGIPPRQDVITQVNAWLEEAERLARNS